MNPLVARSWTTDLARRADRSHSAPLRTARPIKRARFAWSWVRYGKGRGKRKICHDPRLQPTSVPVGLRSPGVVRKRALRERRSPSRIRSRPHRRRQGDHLRRPPRGRSRAVLVPAAAAGVLVDEEFGSSVARKSKKKARRSPCLSRRSGQDEFQFQYGDDFAAHIEAFDPTFAKVLVRYNPEGDAELNQRQDDRLARLSRRLRSTTANFSSSSWCPRPPSNSSLRRGQGAYDKELRPGSRGRGDPYAAGGRRRTRRVEDRGPRQAEDCRRVVAQAQSGGRHGVLCIILGTRSGRDQGSANGSRWRSVRGSTVSPSAGRSGWTCSKRLLAGHVSRGVWGCRRSPSDTRRCTTPTSPAT